jgi:hypothetical protein
VQTDNEQFARAVLTEEVQTWLSNDSRAREWPIEFNNGVLLTESLGHLRVEELYNRLDYLADIVDQIPASPWQRNGQR